MKRAILTAVLAAAAALAGSAAATATGPAGHQHSGADPGHHDMAGMVGRPGDPKQPARTVEVVMKEDNGAMSFVPDRIQIRRGEQIRFELKNQGELDHEMVLGTREANLEHARQMAGNPDMVHEDPNAKRVGPKKTSEMLWRFDKAGTFEFLCLIPGHREAGMAGTIVVR
jgi:uncharacterized cupredoxin-like copper-binding protein